jgi:hypothetical protein
MTPVFSGRAKLVISLAKYGFAPRCAGTDAISLSLNKEMAKETRASNSVLMGKLNYPLPKNFACKILPIENKIFSGPNALKKPARLFAICDYLFWVYAS